MIGEKWKSIMFSEQFIKDSVLMEMQEERLFSIVIKEDITKVRFTEMCDQHFFMELNKERLLRLIKELEMIANTMV